VDGWTAWKVTASGRLLDSLRQELLESVASETGPEADSAAAWDPQRRYERLTQARGRAESGQPDEILVRELLALWNAASRSSQVDHRIEADLSNHGLTTSPSFRKVTLDSAVQLVLTAEEAGAAAVTPLEVDEVGTLDVGLTVGNLPSALGGVMSVPPTASFDQAITIMLLNNYSQLAVLTGTRSLRGAVTWQSIARARHANTHATFAEAIVDARDAKYDQDLIDLLPELYIWDFVFVRNQKDEIAGIVTTADVVKVYQELATPFFLIGELDQVLRQVIAKSFTMDQVRPLIDSDGSRQISSFDDLEMGDYQRVLENPARWEQLAWPLDRVIFTKRLDELRVIRSDVTHFNPDPVPPDAEHKLRFILKLLKSYW
jgi:hypothetical protein